MLDSPGPAAMNCFQTNSLEKAPYCCLSRVSPQAGAACSLPPWNGQEVNLRWVPLASASQAGLAPLGMTAASAAFCRFLPRASLLEKGLSGEMGGGTSIGKVGFRVEVPWEGAHTVLLCPPALNRPPRSTAPCWPCASGVTSIVP